MTRSDKAMAVFLAAVTALVVALPSHAETASRVVSAPVNKTPPHIRLCKPNAKGVVHCQRIA